MGRIYTVPFDNVSVSAAQDLFSLTPADDKPILLHGWSLSNVGGTADAGDAQEELLRLAVIRGNTSVGSGGSSVTPVPVLAADAAAGFTARVNDTTVASAGTPVTIYPDGLNVRIPTPYLFLPEHRIGCTQASTLLVVRLVTAPADAVSMSGVAWVEEIG